MEKTNRGVNNEKDLISVIIPTFNRASYIERAVRSVQSQSYGNLQIVVVDDCSSDGTVHKVRSLSTSDARISLVRHEKNKGAQAARNTGIKASEGAWIAFLDSDDEWLPDSLASRHAMAAAQNVHVVHSECYVVRHPEKIRKPFGVRPLSGRILEQLLREPGPVFPALLVKRSAFEHIGYLDERILSFQEWETSIRLAQHFDFAFVSEPTFVYHCHSGDTISKNHEHEASGYRQIVEKHRPDIIKLLGRKGLARHYETIANLYRNAGRARRARKYLLMALLNRPSTIFSPHYLKNLMANTFPRNG